MLLLCKDRKNYDSDNSNKFVLYPNNGVVTYMLNSEYASSKSLIKLNSYSPTKYKTFLSKVLMSGVMELTLYEDDLVKLVAACDMSDAQINSFSCFLLSIDEKPDKLLINTGKGVNGAFKWVKDVFLSRYNFWASIPFEYAEFLWTTNRWDLVQNDAIRILESTAYSFTNDRYSLIIGLSSVRKMLYG